MNDVINIKNKVVVHLFKNVLVVPGKFQDR